MSVTIYREKIEAAEADPANFRDYARKWREEREARPEAPPTPPAGQEPGTSLGALSTELFGETPQRNNRMSQSKTEGAKP